MADIRPADMHTRRAALTFMAALPVWGQSQTTSQSKGNRMGQPVVHFEIGCRDRTKTEKFYGELFGWQIQSSGPASVINTASDQGIGGHITSLGHEPHHYTIFYVEVDEVQAALDKAVGLGGKVVVPPVKIPTGTFAWFSDLDGNTVGLIQSKR